MRATNETTPGCGKFAAGDQVLSAAFDRALAGRPIDLEHAKGLMTRPRRDLPALVAAAGSVRTSRKGRVITYCPNIFLPITNLCFDRCAYCTFRRDPDSQEAWTMLPEEVCSHAQRGKALGCVEALMCLGDRPERAFRPYRDMLRVLGCATTAEYVEKCCAIALEEGLLPHTNAGLLTRAEMQRLKPLNASLGLMLESTSRRLRRRGEAHQSAPDKDPALRLRMIREAGELKIPFTTGILLGIGETLVERAESLHAIGELQATYGHIQEVIIQNFRAKPGTKMARRPEPESWDVARTVAVARLMMPDMNLQAPPNLSPDDHRLLIAAGINDWGGISPLTCDFVNPEAPWPHLAALNAACRAQGFTLRPRLPVYPEYIDLPGFLDPALREKIPSFPPPHGDHDDQRPAQARQG